MFLYALLLVEQMVKNLMHGYMYITFFCAIADSFNPLTVI